MTQVSTDYNVLFIGDGCTVPPYRSARVEGATEAEVRALLSERGVPLTDTLVDHIGILLLATSWLEDQSTEDENGALEALFSEYPLPWCGAFLGKVEAHATTPFWHTMAPLIRDAISIMWDELGEDSKE